MRDLYGPPRDQLGADARARGKIVPTANLALSRSVAALSRLSHRRADGEKARPLPRQLDLHPRSEREGRPGSEFPLMVAGDGAGRHELPWTRIFLLRG